MEYQIILFTKIKCTRIQNDTQKEPIYIFENRVIMSKSNIYVTKNLFAILITTKKN